MAFCQATPRFLSISTYILTAYISQKGDDNIPALLIGEDEIIKRKTLYGLLKPSELQYGRLGVGIEFLKEYDPVKHKIEVIIRKK